MHLVKYKLCIYSKSTKYEWEEKKTFYFVFKLIYLWRKEKTNATKDV